MNQRITRYAALVLFLVFAQQLLACQTQTSGFSATFRGTTAFTTGDFNDLGAIAMDANNGGGSPTDCAKLAHDSLLQKLKTTPNSAFQQSLAGYHVALIFAAAVRLGAYGWFNTAVNPVTPSTDTLAGQLNRVMGAYQVISHAGGCGLGFSGAPSMDDHAGAAAAYGWMSAYKKKRGDTDTWYAAQTTGNYLAAFFNNVCIYSSSNPGSTDAYNFCNATMAQLSAGQPEAFPFEHGFESPHYGFGLLTSIAQAITGLEAAGAAYPLSADEKTKARALMANLQKHTDPTTFDFYSHNCRRPQWNGSSWYISTNILSCEDFGAGGYNPKMYHLAEFFRDPTQGGHVGNPPSHAYQSNDTCCSTYSGWNLADLNSEFGYGRYATYREQGYTWYAARGNQYSSRYMPFDNNPAQGYLDGVDNNGVAYGWACDADAPGSFVKVDLYANGTKVADANDQFARSGSEPAVNQLCGGGSAHRFYAQLPWGLQGQQITAKARDYTFRPAVTLGCVTECVW